MLTLMAEVTCGFYPTLTGDRTLYQLWFEQTDTRMHPEKTCGFQQHLININYQRVFLVNDMISERQHKPSSGWCIFDIDYW